MRSGPRWQHGSRLLGAVTGGLDCVLQLDDARWFGRDELMDLYVSGREGGRLSRPDSISRWLIEDWLRDPA